MRGEIIEFFIIKQIKKPRLVLYSVVKHLGSGRALEKWGKTLDCVSCFPLHFFRALPLPACFTTEHSTVEASLFVNYKTTTLTTKTIIIEKTAKYCRYLGLVLPVRNTTNGNDQLSSVLVPSCSVVFIVFTEGLFLS